MGSDGSDDGSSFGSSGDCTESDEEAFHESIINELEGCRKTLEDADEHGLTSEQIMELEDSIEACLDVHWE
jgi:hypothetical protein